MPDANDRQHGGNHYKKNAYEHWDFVCDTGQHYLIGCATKYASRWQDKGGIQDLDKMVHYLDKAEERGVMAPQDVDGRLWDGFVSHFCDQLGSVEAVLVGDIMAGRWGNVRAYVEEIKEERRAASV